MILLPSQRRSAAFCDPRFTRVFCTVVLAGVLLLALLLVGALHLVLQRGP